jgi:sulfhydrogenase subunit beta (sulfur reductase)
MSVQQVKSKITITADNLKSLIDALAQKGYRNIGPTVRDEAIVYDDISKLSDLPQGWSDEQDRASYRLKKRSDKAYFGYTKGVQSWKRFLHPPTRHIWGAAKDGQGFKLEEKANDFPKMAFIGVRPCELSAISILDKILIDGPYKDISYATLRKNIFIVAVNCSEAGGTCFCASMKTGPQATQGFDLALTELISGGSHRFLVEIGSEAGAELLSKITHQEASRADCDAAEAIVNQTASNMGRKVDNNGIKEILYRNYDNPEWDLAAKRCLTCGNCTMVCPTCFCTTVEDSTDLVGSRADRTQKWDTCFTVDFSYIHGGSIRPSSKSRYRQMVTHKFAAWHDQFGSAGCVGCGRCITWCPAAIDITDEINAVRESDQKNAVSIQAKGGR